MKRKKTIAAAVLAGTLGLAALGANGCNGCLGSSDWGEVHLSLATPLPADHYVGGDAATRAIDGPRAECITCHPVSQE